MPKSLAEELASKTVRRGRTSTYTEEERKSRQQTMAAAAQMATSVLKTRHEEEYRQLYAQAKQELGI